MALKKKIKKALKLPAQLAKRAISDEGARRVASWKGAQRKLKERRYHKWLKGDAEAEPMHDRLQSFATDPNWRIFRIMAEFIDGYDFLDSLRAEVTIFGSARAQTIDEHYQSAKDLGYLLGKEGYTVITGGGPGIMEAANWGAYEAEGDSIGLDIELPTEQRRNQFVTRAVGFHHFFTRKVMLSASAQAYVFFPGGFGTLDELSEMVTLIQTGKIPRNVPVILFGKAFWAPFIEWIKTHILGKNRYVNEEDLDILRVVDTPAEAMKIIRKTTERPYGSFTSAPPKVLEVPTRRKRLSRSRPPR